MKHIRYTVLISRLIWRALEWSRTMTCLTLNLIWDLVLDLTPCVAGQPISEASSRGVEWVIENIDEMSTGRAFATAHSLYRTVADEAPAPKLIRVP